MTIWHAPYDIDVHVNDETGELWGDDIWPLVERWAEGKTSSDEDKIVAVIAALVAENHRKWVKSLH